MKQSAIRTLVVFFAFFCFFVAGFSLAEAKSAGKIVIGHPACLSGKYAKAGEQAIGGIKACIAG